MDAATWQRVRAAFERLCELPEAERESQIAAVCGDDTAIEEQVRAMLRQTEERGPLESLADRLDRPQEHDGAPSKAWVGRVLSGNRLERVLGRGGMGLVFEAQDLRTGRAVALKVLRNGQPGSRIRFDREVERLRSLDHPGIVPILGVGSSEEGWPYYWMPVLAGSRIDHFCDGRRMTVTDRLTVLANLCEVVAYAHECGVVHRDLKPSNVMIVNDSPVLLDFGVAKVLGNDGSAPVSTLSFEVRSLTPAYASPEHLEGSAVSARSDVFSLGALAYKLLAGSPPLFSEGAPLSPARVLPRGADLVEVSELRSTSPGTLKRRLGWPVSDVLRWACSVDPAERYASAEEFADELLACARPSVARVGRFIRRRF